MNSSDKQTILIAEDEPVLREAYVTILRHAGYEVVEAEDGRQALDKVTADPPDLLVLDMLMPGKTGLEVLRDSRMQKVRCSVKVIAFTNLSDPDTIEELRSLGVDRYLLKASVLPQMFIQNVRDVLAGIPETDTMARTF